MGHLNSKIPWPMAIISGAGLVYGSTIIFKDKYGGGDYVIETGSNIEASIKGKTVIITGANSGIGKETALEFARHGARVLMACRDKEKCHEVRKDIIRDTSNLHVVCRECDLASFKSIQEFAERVNKEEVRVDVLVNNAGVMSCPRGVTREGIETQLGVNHMGHFLLTHLLLDKLKSCSPSRIVNITCRLHMKGSINFSDLNSEASYDKDKSYYQSKLANVMFTTELAKRLQGSGVSVNCVHPGISQTNIGRHTPLYQNTFFGYLGYIATRPFTWFVGKSPEQASRAVMFLAVDDENKNVSGKYFQGFEVSSPSEAAQNEADAARLWATSEVWTKLQS